MNEFLKFFDEKTSSFPMHLEIGYCKVTDWRILIYKKGCAEDYPLSESDEGDAIICNIQEQDMELAFAKAYVELKEWLMKNDGGY